MASLRSLAGCVGVSGPFSVLRDYFGFFRGRIPPDPTGVGLQVSIKEQIASLRSEHFHLNVIAVGSDQFTDNDYIEIDYSIHKLRNIYRSVGVGVGRIQHEVITTSDANGLDMPTTTGDLEDLTQAWTVDNDGIDLFVPHNMMITGSSGGIILGYSPIDGPCDKDANDMNGATCGLWGSEQTARTMAHELGHYLGLEHNHGEKCPTTTAEKDNLMAQSRCANSTRNSVILTSSQGDNMDDHCSINDGCPG